MEKWDLFVARVGSLESLDDVSIHLGGGIFSIQTQEGLI